MIGYIAEQLFIGIATGAIYAIIAVGLNLIFGTMNVLNMAHGSAIMIGSFGVLLFNYIGDRYFGYTNFWLGCVAGLFLAFLTGLLVERLAVRPMKGNWWNTKIATIGMAFILENLVTVLTEGRPQLYPRPFEPTYYVVLGDLDNPGLWLIEISNVHMLLIGISVIMVAGMVWFLYRTTTGKAVRVVSQSQEIARCVGIDVKKSIIVGFGVSATLAGVAGILNGVTFGSTYSFIGFQLILKGIVVVIVAGIGNMRGCLWVGVILGVIESMSVAFGESTYRDFFSYGIMVLILIWRPWGIFGEEGRVTREV